MPGDIIEFPRKGAPRSPKDAFKGVRDDYAQYLITQGRTPDTIRTYLSNVEFYATWQRQRGLPLISASRNHIESYIADQLGRVARSTAMNRLLACRSFYRYLVAARRRTSDPTEHIPVKRDKLQPPKPYTEAEMRAIVAEATSGNGKHPEMLTIILLFIGSGCRRNEIMGMQVGDIDWARSRILIHGKGRKERWVAPGATAMKSLADYVTTKEGPVFRISGHMMCKLLRDIGRRASVVGTHPHRFRGTFAYTFLKHYGNLPALKELMGHENLKTTEVYATWGIAEGALTMQAGLDLASSYT